MEKVFFEARRASELPASLRESIVVLGNLDGVHRGHQELLRRAHSLARELGGTQPLPVVVMTFDPHPVQVLGGKAHFRRLFSLAEQAELLRRAGAQGVFYRSFTLEFSQLPAEDFLNQELLPLLHPRAIVVGFNFRFGRNRAGNPEMLRAWGSRHDVGIEIVDAFQVEGETVSSSAIRTALAQGDLEKVRRLLGFGFFMRGPVVSGAKRGAGLGFPTANLEFSEGGLLSPGYGVYATRSFFVGAPSQGIPSVSHLGPLPTFADERPRLETHLLDFSGNLYGQILKVEFLRKLRDPMKFAGLSELQQQIRRDIESAREVHREPIVPATL